MRDPRQLFHDLLAIEVNTIIKNDITAEKMPSLPFALLDIVQCYAEALGRAGAKLQRYFGPEVSHAKLIDRANAHYQRYLAVEQGKDQGLDNQETDRLVEYWTMAKATYEARCGKPFRGSEGSQLWNYLPHLWPLLIGNGNQDPVEAFVQDADYRFTMDEVTNGWASFERVRIACKELLAQSEREQRDLSEFEITRRMLGCCNQVKYVVQGLQQRHLEPPRFLGRRRKVADWSELIPRTRMQLLQGDLHGMRTPDLLRDQDYRVIRKCWELGSERIVVQTSVQLDGDVVTRLSTELLDKHGEEVRQLLLATHYDAVKVGIEHWKSLVETTTELVSRFSNFLRGLVR